MKKTLLATLATGFFLVGGGGIANAYMVDTVDVGSLDTYLNFYATQETIQSYGGTAEEQELAWIQDMLDDPNLTYFKEDHTDKDGNPIVGAEQWQETNDLDVIAYDFVTSTPEYFVLKTGRITEPSAAGEDGEYDYRWFLYENDNESLSWGVVDLTSVLYSLGLVDYTLFEIARISHTVESSTNAVPEPATMLLFGTGLAGLAAVARRRKN